MDSQHFEQLTRLRELIERPDAPGSDSRVYTDAEADAEGNRVEIVLDSNPSGAAAHILLLAVWLGIPIWLALIEPGWFEWLIATGWLLVIGRTIWSIVRIDSAARFDTRQRQVRVANINPVIGWLRRVFPIRFGWEGEFAWSEIEGIRVESRIHTKSQDSYVVFMTTFSGKKLPAAAFEKVNIAHGVADILREMLGLREPSLPR